VEVKGRGKGGEEKNDKDLTNLSLDPVNLGNNKKKPERKVWENAIRESHGLSLTDRRLGERIKDP